MAECAQDISLRVKSSPIWAVGTFERWAMDGRMEGRTEGMEDVDESAPQTSPCLWSVGLRARVRVEDGCKEGGVGRAG